MSFFDKIKDHLDKIVDKKQSLKYTTSWQDYAEINGKSDKNINYKHLDYLENKYRKYLKEHSKNKDEINRLYVLANKQLNIHGIEMQKVIDLCLKDIENATYYMEYWTEWQKTRNQKQYNFKYSTFKQLAIIYEKQEKYEEAILICQQAIDLGFYRDGTTGQMPGRMARLKKKYEK